jgi:hypothetical protein
VVNVCMHDTLSAAAPAACWCKLDAATGSGADLFSFGHGRPATVGYTHNLHSVNAHDVGNTFTSYARVGNWRNMAVHVWRHTQCWW